jgi:hypothetical protein
MLVRFRKNFFVNLQKFVKMVNVQHFQLTFTGFTNFYCIYVH